MWVHLENEIKSQLIKGQEDRAHVQAPKEEAAKKEEENREGK